MTETDRDRPRSNTYSPSEPATPDLSGRKNSNRSKGNPSEDSWQASGAEAICPKPGTVCYPLGPSRFLPLGLISSWARTSAGLSVGQHSDAQSPTPTSSRHGGPTTQGMRRMGANSDMKSDRKGVLRLVPTGKHHATRAMLSHLRAEQSSPNSCLPARLSCVLHRPRRPLSHRIYISLRYP